MLVSFNMPEFKSIQDFLERGNKYYVPSLSVDCVIFGFHGSQLKVLLLQPKRTKGWALPGGFVYRNEHIDDSAYRTLKERTGLHDIFLQQFYVFGHQNRSDKSYTIEAFKKRSINVPKDHWIKQRFISAGYYALVNFAAVQPTVDNISAACQWWDVHELPPLLMDHAEIFKQALLALRKHLSYQPLGYNLLPAKFSMPELQKLYETILDQKLDRRNFQRKILSYGILRRLKERRKNVAHKAPFLYSFDLRIYHKALKEGLKNGW